MAELIAQGSKFENRWRRKLVEGTSIGLGRSCHGFSVGWDAQISRQHATLVLQDSILHVQKFESAGNPIFFLGKETDSFSLTQGQHFVIGETTFNFSANQALATADVPHPVQQKTFSHQFLKQVRYRDADRRIGVLNRLPDVIASAVNEDDLLTKMVNTLLTGIWSASTVGIVKYQCHDDETEVVHWDRRSLNGGDFEASQRLVRQAIDGGETVLHFWDKSKSSAAAGQTAKYTFDLSNDWAFACPLDDISAGKDRWVVYVTGRNRGPSDSVPGDPSGLLSPIAKPTTQSSEADLEGDIKFCELIASTLCNLLYLRKLERRQVSLRRFFSPAVLQAFADADPDEVLQPRQCRVSVLFCDLRGFSKTSEAMSDDLLKLLAVVSQSLGVMTRVIFQQGGVIGDFHGDAAMGFWGWPLDQPDGAAKAVTAAIEIQRQINSKASQSNTGGASLFRMGIGIGTGQAVAGRIGTDDQVKVTAFGPVVNVASRLEGMTQELGCPILIDQTTASELGSSLNPIPMGSILPFSMQRPVNVFRIDASSQEGSLSVRQTQMLHAAVSDFSGGRWRLVAEHLQAIPDGDPTKALLIDAMAGQDSPPENFDGLIRMKRK
jgi:adenylate cyclase